MAASSRDATYDLGPYDAISSLAGARYKIITPGEQPFMARVVAEVPDLEMARKIVAALNSIPSETEPRKCPKCGEVWTDFMEWYDGPHCPEAK